MEAESAEVSSCRERMESFTPHSSMYASSTDLTDTNTSIDQIEYWFCTSPRFSSMDDMLADFDAICSNCRPEFEGIKDRMLSTVNDLKIQFDALQKIQNDVEEQLWDAWQDNQRYQEEVLNLQRELAEREDHQSKCDILLKEPAAFPDARRATICLSKLMGKITEEMADLEKQPENSKEKEVLNTAMKILEKRTKFLETKRGIKGNLVEKCAFMLRNRNNGGGNQFEITRGEFLDGDKIFSQGYQNDVYIFKTASDKGESAEILQFDPNFQFSQVSCGFSHCTKLRHHLTPSKSPNSSVANLSNNNIPKRPLYICPKHRKQLKEELKLLLKEAGFDCTSFPKSTSRTCEDVLEIIKALNDVCSRYFDGETNDLKQTELFLNCRNFLIVVDALVLPCSHSEYHAIHQFLCLLFLHLNGTLAQELYDLIHDYIHIFCNFYGIRYSWVSISPWWGIVNPGAIIGGGIGVGLLKFTEICDFKAAGLLGFCGFFCSAIWNSLSSHRFLRKHAIGRVKDELYGVYVEKSNIKITHNSRIMINIIHREKLTTSLGSGINRLLSKSIDLSKI